MLDFEVIAQLRQHKANRIQAILARAKKKTEKLQDNVQVAQRKVDDFLEQNRTLEIDLLTDLLDVSVKINDILKIEEILRKVKQKAELLAEELSEAKENFRLACENESELRIEKNNIDKRVEKTSWLHQEMLAQQQNVMAIKEDAEIEEFNNTSFFRKFG